MVDRVLIGKKLIKRQSIPLTGVFIGDPLGDDPIDTMFKTPRIILNRRRS